MLRLPKLALVSLTVAAALRLAAGDAYTPTHPPLAQGKTKFLGSCYSAAQATDFLAYFNQVTPENAGKWGSVEATRDVMNWTELDTAYQLAKTNNLKFRFHILVWGSQQPSWISSLSTAEKLDEIKEWYAAVAARYPDIDYLEVVNEPLHAPPNGETIAFSPTAAANYADALGGAGTSGWDWVIEAFKLARQYFPGKKLVLNEYGVLNDAANMAKYVAIVNLLKAQNLVDVVAVQAHSFETKSYATSTLAANLETLAATGLPIMITEMDIDDTTAAPQLADYQRIFPLLWEHPSVTGITLWGFRPGMWRGDQGANLVNADGTEKPAMVWLKEYVRNNLPVVTAGQSFAISPTSATGATVGTVLATDADSGAVLQDWSIVGGNGASVFAINAGTGVLTVANGASLNFTANPTYTVQVKVGDGIGHSVAAAVTISAGNQPAFTTSPAATTVALGGNVTFTAAASGSPTFQWQYSHDNATFADIAGANAATYTISGAAYSASGYYRVVATNSYGSATSAAASLAVLPGTVATLRADGYGASATGGGTGAQALTATTAAELQAAVASGSRTITVAGTLDIGTLALASNTTLQGADANAALIGTVRIGSGVSNVVVRGLTLSSASGNALEIAGASNVFVTRCTFLDSADHQIRISNAANNVTVSWCEFAASSASVAHRYSVLIGVAGSESQAMKISLHHNWWTSHIDQRMPLAVYGQVHFYNNFVEAAANTSGTVADNQTQLLNERNAYEGVNSPLTKQQTNTALAAGKIQTLGTLYTACTGTAPDAGTDSVFVPSYSYALHTAADVADLVALGAGNNAGVGYTEATSGTASITGPAAAVAPNATLTLTASVSGVTPTGYQWRMNNVDVAGQTAATFTATMDSTRAGIYTVVVSQASGPSIVSTPFTVTLGTSTNNGGGSTGGGSTGGGSTGGSSSGGGGGGAFGLWFVAALAALGLGRRRFSNGR